MKYCSRWVALLILHPFASIDAQLGRSLDLWIYFTVCHSLDRTSDWHGSRLFRHPSHHNNLLHLQHRLLPSSGFGYKSVLQFCKTRDRNDLCILRHCVGRSDWLSIYLFVLCTVWLLSSVHSDCRLDVEREGDSSKDRNAARWRIKTSLNIKCAAFRSMKTTNTLFRNYNWESHDQQPQRSLFLSSYIPLFTTA